ncbi:hypothetical protein Goarm_009245 [Gossypium armourianum]|uniref:Uncharacterized protein n=1 Tax=Gossypium armourianum TaxID=34283 RepID=A0A7J9JSC3_9ROSI|nr:hypothetical protein [Gossypium armourianum]
MVLLSSFFQDLKDLFLLNLKPGMLVWVIQKKLNSFTTL